MFYQLLSGLFTFKEKVEIWQYLIFINLIRVSSDKASFHFFGHEHWPFRNISANLQKCFVWETMLLVHLYVLKTLLINYLDMLELYALPQM